MANIMDYLAWRGDLFFTQDPPGAVDAMVFSTLSYLHFVDEIKDKPDVPCTIENMAKAFFALPDWESRGRNKNDCELLRQAAETYRYKTCEILHYQELFDPDQDTQFAAVTFRLNDGSLMVAFRGTDNTLVGWKEDFNMCFQQTVPAQRLAEQYLHEIITIYNAPIRICGHSKGGNLAVFAASRMSPMLQNWIEDVYSFDGPGFSDYMMGDPGYLAMVPRIHTYVPQSSVIGLIMEHEEPCMVVKSSAIGGLLQHDLMTWEILGREPVFFGELTGNAIFVDSVLTNWLASMNTEERNQMVEVIFGFLETGDVTSASDIFQLKTIKSYIKTVRTDENTRKLLYDQIIRLYDAAKKSRHQLEEVKLLSESSEIPEIKTTMEIR